MIHALLVAGIVFTVLGAIALPVNLIAFPRLSDAARQAPPGASPRVSVVIPARNEELDIEATVRSHLSTDYPDFQVVVVDDRSTDATANILGKLAREVPRLVVVSGTDPPGGWLGKPHALWEGAQVADGEILLFADADVRYDPRAIREAVALLDARSLDLLTFFPHFEMRGFWENVLLPFLGVTVFLGLGFVAASRRARGLALGAGAGNLVRRSTYDAVGGHEALRNSVVDDVRLANAVKRAGFPVAAFRAGDRVSVRIYRGFRAVWNGFTKNVAWAFAGAWGAVLLPLVTFVLFLWIVPAVTLLGAAAGAHVASGDVRLAAVLLGATILLRAALARSLGDPLWPAVTHPIMAAVWTGLLGRSLFHRFVRRRLTWRGREYDARRARF